MLCWTTGTKFVVFRAGMKGRYLQDTVLNGLMSLIFSLSTFCTLVDNSSILSGGFHSHPMESGFFASLLVALSWLLIISLAGLLVTELITMKQMSRPLGL